MTNGNGHASGHHPNGHANGHGRSNGKPVDRLTDLIRKPEERDVPHSDPMERGVLGALLIDGSAMGQVAEMLRPADFWARDHQTVFKAMLSLHGAGKPIDAFLVAEEMKRAGDVVPDDEDLFLIGLAGGVPHAENVVYHAEKVRELSRKRGWIKLGLALIEDGYSTEDTAAAIAEKAKHRIESLSGDESRADEASRKREPVRVADLGDIRRVAGESRWLWEGWLMDQHMTVLAAEPGVGKTRLACDIIRRMWHALQWPDGQLASRPPGTSSLWVASDRNHAELLQIARDFNLPDEAIRFNAQPEDPFGCLKLDNPQDLADLRARIEIARPGIVVIDTINKATRRLLYRPEEAEAFFGPLLDVALATATPILALTHLSKGGDPLDRRIEGFCRVMWKMERPDPDGQPHRRVLKVTKSNSLYPAAHGVSMGSDGNQYDLDPPKAPEWKAKVTVAGDDATTGAGRPPKALAAAMDWLREKLAEGPIYCAKLIDDANKAGHGRNTFNRALTALKVVKGGPEGMQFYRLPAEGEEPDPIDDGE